MNKIIAASVLVALVIPFASFATGSALPTCTAVANRSSVPLGVPTQVTVTITTANADTLDIEGQGTSAAKATDTRTYTLSSATRIVMYALNSATNEAHRCVVSISSVSNRTPN